MEITSAPDVEENKRVKEIVDKVQLAVENLEKSSFFRDFTEQMRHPELVAQIERVIGTDPQYQQLQLVLYGVGGLERVPMFPRVEISHAQLAFAILLRDKFQWVSDIDVYDPWVPPLQQKSINAFNCTFLSVNEFGKRTVERPTLFYMPRCPNVLVHNVLRANWTTTNLNKIIILGSSFMGIKKTIPNNECPDLLALKHFQAILHSDNILHEMPLPEPETSEPSSLYPKGLHKMAFRGFSWHFFTLDGCIEDLNLDLFPEALDTSSFLESTFLS